jgi:curved DNA-binding protein CbpA
MSNDLRRVIDEEEVTYSWSRKKANPDLKQQDVPKEKRMPESPTPIGVEVQDGNLPAATADSGEPPADSRGKLPSRGKSPSQRREGPERNSSDASHNNARASKKISFDPKDLAVVASKAESKAPANGSRGRPTEAGKQQSHAIDLGKAQEAKGQRMTDCTQRPDVAAKVVAYDGGKVCLTTGAMSKACGRELLHWARGELSNELACLHIDDWSQGQITWPETAGSSVQNRFGLLAGMLADAALKRTHIASLRTDCFSGSPWEVMRKGVQAVLDMTRLEGSGNTILASEVENALVRLESCANVDGPAKQLEFSVQRELLRLFWTDATPNFAECELDDAWLLQFLAQTHQQVRDMASTTPLATLREQNEFLDNYLVRLLRLKRALVTLVDRWEKVDYYAVLGVSPTASDKEIKAAYRKACLRLHPDKGGDKTQFQQLQDAYAQILEERAKKDSEHAKKNPENGTGSNSGAGTNQKGSQQGGRSTGATKVSTCLQLENDPGSAKANAEMEQTSSADGEVAMAEQRLNELVESINGRVHSAEQAEAKVQRLKKDKGGVDALQAAQEAGKTMLALSEELGTLGDTFSEAVMEVAESSLALAARFAMIPSAMLLTDVALSCTFEASRIQHAAHQLKEVRRDTVSTLQTLDTNLSMAKIIGSIDTETFKLSLGLVAKATSRIISSIRSAAVAVKDATTRGRQCKVHAKAVVAFASGRSAADLEAEDVTVHGALPAPETCNVPQDPEVPSEQAPPKAETEASPAEERNGASGQKPENALPNEWSAAVQGQVQNHRLFQQINADLMALQQRARAHLSKCGKAQQLADVPASDCDSVFQLVGEALLAATEKTIGELDTAHASADILESLLSRHFAFVERCGSSLASTLDLRTQLVRLAALLDAQAVIVALEKEVKPRLASHCGSAEKELHASLFSSLDRQFELLCSAVVAARLP